MILLKQRTERQDEQKKIMRKNFKQNDKMISYL